MSDTLNPQPFDTAPKDGTWILALGIDHGEPRAYAAFWSKDDDDASETGWYESEASSHKVTDFFTPTHWMPMPEGFDQFD